MSSEIGTVSPLLSVWCSIVLTAELTACRLSDVLVTHISRSSRIVLNLEWLRAYYILFFKIIYLLLRAALLVYSLLEKRSYVLVLEEILLNLVSKLEGSI